MAASAAKAAAGKCLLSPVPNPGLWDYYSNEGIDDDQPGIRYSIQPPNGLHRCHVVVVMRNGGCGWKYFFRERKVFNFLHFSSIVRRRAAL